MRRRSIRYRLLVLCLSLTVIPVLMLTWLAAANIRRSVEAAVVEANLVRVRWAGQYLEDQLARIRDLFYVLQIQDEVRDAVEPFGDIREGRGNGDSDTVLVDLQRILASTYIANSTEIDDLALYIRSWNEAVIVDSAIVGERTRPDMSSGRWSGVAEDPVSLAVVRADDGLYAVQSINRFIGQQFIGAISAHIDDRHYGEMLSIIGPDSPSSVFLLDGNGNRLLQTMPEHDPDQYSSMDLRTRKGETSVIRLDRDIVVVRPLDIANLTLVKVVPVSVVRQSARPTITAGLLIAGILVFLSGLVSILFALRFSRPIIDLARVMVNAPLPEFQLREISGRDEVGMLEEGYNTLMTRMRTMIDHEYVREIQLRDARLQALQAQINPHFLHNTLHMLGGMALAKDAPEIYTITRAIGDLFRYAADTDGDLVNLSEELTHTRNYLLIQERRFDGRCKVDIRSDDGIGTAAIPRFTLQPILENAFIHGLENKTGPWMISVRIARKKHGILIMVRDNGIGMDDQQLHRIRDRLGQAAESQYDFGQSIGLGNVDGRLKLHFGRPYGIRLFSVQNEGTLVVIRIPANLSREVQDV